MRFAWALAAILLIAGTASGASPVKLDLTFHAPAQGSGDFSLNGGQWMLLVFAPETKSEFELRSAGGESANYTDARYRVDENPNAYVNDNRQIESESANLPKPFSATIGIGNTRWSALYVEAENLDVHVDGADAVMVRSKANSPAKNALPEHFVPAATIHSTVPKVPVASVAVGFDSAAGSLPFRITARDVHVIHWYNATVGCSTVGYCPETQDYRAIPVAGRTNDVLEFRTYTELQLASGQLTGEGDLLMMAVGGPSLDLAATGAVRLPDAITDCTDCLTLNHETFTSSGSIRLQNLEPEASTTDRVQTHMQGVLTSAAADEFLIPGFSAGKAAAGAAIATGLVVLIKAALAFFTRHQRPALDNPRIRQTFEFIVAQPGLSFSDLRRLAEAGTGDLQRQLKRLLDERLVVSREYRNSLRFFENHGRYDGSWEGHAVLQDESNRLLHDWLMARPGSSQVQMRATDAAFTKGVVQKSLKRLAAAGLVTAKREGRNVYYWALPAIKPAGAAP